MSVTGVTVPESYVRQWHDWYYEGEKEPKYASFHLILQSSDVVSDVRKSVETLGLQSRNSGEIADKVALLTRYLSLATGILMMVFLLLAGLGTAQTLGLEVTYHSQKIGLYRALGASRRDITRVYILRALTIGIVGAFCGTLPAVVLLSSAENMDGPYLPVYRSITFIAVSRIPGHTGDCPYSLHRCKSGSRIWSRTSRVSSGARYGFSSTGKHNHARKEIPTSIPRRNAHSR